MAPPPQPVIAASASTAIDYAWFLLIVLVRLGRPFLPDEIASILLQTVDLPELLSQIHSSPLLLTEGGLVTVPETAIRALYAFIENATFPFSRTAGIRVLWRKERGRVALTYARKRKREDSQIVVLEAKRRLLLPSGRDFYEVKGGRVNSCLLSQPNTTHLNKDDPFVCTHAKKFELGFLNKAGILIPSYNQMLLSSSYELQRSDPIVDHSTLKSCRGSTSVLLSASASERIPVEWVRLFEPDGLLDSSNSMEESKIISNMACLPESEEDQNIIITEFCPSNHVVPQAEVEIDCAALRPSKQNLHNDFAPREPETVHPNEFEIKESHQKMTSFSPKTYRTSKQHRTDERHSLNKHRMKKTNGHKNPKENKSDASEEIVPIVYNKSQKSSSKTLERKELPHFDCFEVEEEEGSGGYGTVYKARRKMDGNIFAIKCPHANASLRHVTNEMKMLQRFGGKNFVIKFEGSFKNGDAQCFILQHVEHDRPEVLKKEINLFELQWYGFCLFRALSSLHRKGIVHRDVKPGNFLFSRKLNKGYLIDFNLALDLQHKYSWNGNTESKSSTNYGSLHVPSSNPAPFDPSIKSHTDPRKTLSSKSSKNKTGKAESNSFTSRTKSGGQVAETSVVTSARDPTSTRTSSAERLKQLILCKGRKELINFAQMQSTPKKIKTSATTVSASWRKRVAALPGRTGPRPLVLTPMPLCTGGKVKQKREGPCVGTKGFRAPEVLFKSCYQSCKVDVWSVGVTLLYLMIGRAPFGGDSNQNIKEIVKLRGSEEMWEVAKLHDRESFFPQELLDVRFMKPVDLHSWCTTNARRHELLKAAPPSLFDLIDRCLEANPRRRITAEEALKHEFFSPCHESLRRNRMLRKAEPSSSR